MVTSKAAGCQDDGVEDVTDRTRLEPCHVHVEPPMKPEVERLTYPEELAQSLDLDVTTGESGLTISGWTFDLFIFLFIYIINQTKDPQVSDMS